MAYQIGFDLYESATQDFLQRVQRALRKTEPSTALDNATSTAERYILDIHCEHLKTILLIYMSIEYMIWIKCKTQVIIVLPCIKLS